MGTKQNMRNQNQIVKQRNKQAREHNKMLQRQQRQQAKTIERQQRQAAKQQNGMPNQMPNYLANNPIPVTRMQNSSPPIRIPETAMHQPPCTSSRHLQNPLPEGMPHTNGEGKVASKMSKRDKLLAKAEEAKENGKMKKYD